MQAVLTDIYEEYELKQKGYTDAIRAGLELFFIGFLRQPENPGGLNHGVNAYTQERFEEFSSLLEQHFSTHKQVSDYARFMSLSTYQLNGVTKTMVSKTASALIDEYILLEAKRYLLATPQQVKDIADRLGYEDPSYFIRFFRKHTGLSPEAFRKNSLQLG